MTDPPSASAQRPAASTSAGRGTAGGWVAAFAVGGGALAWFADLNVSYLLVPLACTRDLVFLLHLSTGVFAAVGLAAAVVAARLFSAARRDPSQREGRSMLGLAGLLLNVLFVAVILVTSIANVMIHPCE